MTDPEDPNASSNVSKRFLERTAAARELNDQIAYDIVTAQLWEGIVTNHRAQVLDRLNTMSQIVAHIDSELAAIAGAVVLPAPEEIERRAERALVEARKMLRGCSEERYDEPQLVRGKELFAETVSRMMSKAIMLLETYTELGHTKGPEKLPIILNKLVRKNLILPEECPAITEAVYPKGAKVVPFAPAKK